MDSKLHHLKTDPKYFNLLQRGEKSFDVRKNDRDFKVGEMINFQEYDPEKKEYTGREFRRIIQFILDGGQYGIHKGYVVMAVCNMKSYILRSIIGSANETMEHETPNMDHPIFGSHPTAHFSEFGFKPQDSFTKNVIELFREFESKHFDQTDLSENRKTISAMDMIRNERREQIEKHGYTIEGDKKYTEGQLETVAMFLIQSVSNECTPNDIESTFSCPEEFEETVKQKILKKDKIGRLVVAGAFLLAEYDRTRNPKLLMLCSIVGKTLEPMLLYERLTKLEI